MKIEINGRLPKTKDIEGVPEEFLISSEPAPLVQMKLDAVESKRFKYRRFYDELIAFHERFFEPKTDDDWAQLFDGIVFLDNSCPPEFRGKLIAAVVDEIETRVIGAKI